MFGFAFVLLLMSVAPVSAGRDDLHAPVTLSTRLVALKSSDEMPAVGRPGSWFDRRTDSILKRKWHHSWIVYPASIGSGWGLKLRWRF